jgi:hypothetical protein
MASSLRYYDELARSTLTDDAGRVNHEALDTMLSFAVIAVTTR